MDFQSTALKEVVLITLDKHEDNRGYFFERYRQSIFAEAGIIETFVQTNLSYSKKNVLRGLHYQQPLQSKLVTVLSGKIYDVAVDVRRDSPNYGQWIAVTLDSEKPQQLYIPAGFAHGFYVLADALVEYSCSDYYNPETEQGINWQDPNLAIEWPLEGEPVLSVKDSQWPDL